MKAKVELIHELKVLDILSVGTTFVWYSLIKALYLVCLDCKIALSIIEL